MLIFVEMMNTRNHFTNLSCTTEMVLVGMRFVVQVYLI